MTEEKKEVQTSAEPEYVGPPKSRAFKSNAPDLPSSANASQITLTPPTPMPQQLDESELIDESSILMDTTATDFKGDGGSNELLRAIAASEPAAQTDKKKKAQKKEIDFKELKKKAEELWEKRKLIKVFCDEHAKLLRALNYLWMLAKVTFYCAGLAFFVLGTFFYLSFESLVRSYLDGKGLENVTFEKINYSLSGFTLANVKEKNGLFSINQVKAQYSFADILEKKIPFVEINTLKIFLQGDTGPKNNTQEFVRVLLALGIFDKDSMLSIKSFHLENSMLYVGDKEYRLPVSFSGIGSLENTKHIIFPITLKNEYIDLNANVDVDISASSTKWKMEIVQAILSLPNFDDQNLKGTAIFGTSNGRLVSFNYTGQIKDDERFRDITMQWNKNAQDLWTANIVLTTPHRTESTVYTLNLSNVVINDDMKSFKTDAPLSLKITKFQSRKLNFDSLKLALRGSLECSTNGCSYFIKEKSDATAIMPSYSFYETPFLNNIEIFASKEPALLLDEDGIRFNVNFKPGSFYLHRKTDSEVEQKTNVNLSASMIKGIFRFEDRYTDMDFLTNFQEIDDSSFSLRNGSIKLKLSDDGLSTKITARKARLKEFGYFKPEVNLNLVVDTNNYFKADAKTNENNLSLKMEGYYNPDNMNILMNVQTEGPIIFKEGQPLPQDLSSFFSDSLKDVKGNVYLKGEIHYKGPRSISGPLKVLIDDLSFTYGNTIVKGLNTVLNISQIIPFGAQGLQNVYAESVTNIFPFTNVSAQIFFDANRKQFNFSSLSAEVGGYPLYIDPMWYNYTSPIYTFNLKGRTTPAQNILKGLNLKNLTIRGNANVNMALQLENSEVSLKSFEFLVPLEGSLSYTPRVYPHAYLENLKKLDFRKLSVYLSEQGKENELIFSSENKANKVRKKTSFRTKIDKPLKEYVLPQKTVIPNFVKEEKGKF